MLVRYNGFSERTFRKFFSPSLCSYHKVKKQAFVSETLTGKKKPPKINGNLKSQSVSGTEVHHFIIQLMRAVTQSTI